MNKDTPGFLFPVLVIALVFARCCLAQPAAIRIGVISSLDPIGAVWSSSANLGFKQAEEDINARGGVSGKKLEVIFEDDRFDPKRAVAAYHKLVEIDRVDFVLGPQF